MYVCMYVCKSSFTIRQCIYTCTWGNLGENRFLTLTTYTQPLDLSLSEYPCRVFHRTDNPMTTMFWKIQQGFRRHWVYVYRLFSFNALRITLLLRHLKLNSIRLFCIVFESSRCPPISCEGRLFDIVRCLKLDVKGTLQSFKIFIKHHFNF